MTTLQTTNPTPYNTTSIPPTLYVRPRMGVRYFTPAKRCQREHYWQQRLSHLFAKQRY